MIAWLENLNNFLNANNGTITALATVVLAVITFWYAYLTRKILKASDTPDIRVFLSQVGGGSIGMYTLDLCVENIGTGFARDVHFSGDFISLRPQFSKEPLSEYDDIKHGRSHLGSGKQIRIALFFQYQQSDLPERTSNAVVNYRDIDLIATDPPFNSKRDYFVPFRDEYGQEPDTLVRAFSDTWTWGGAAEEAYRNLLVEEGGQIGDTIQGLRQFLNETPMMAYLVMMAVRIVEMHRILKSTGSFYLHCDPSASHYLKIVSDAIFSAGQLRNEIVWCYTGPGSPNMRQFNRKHDIIFWYSKGDEWTFNSDVIRIPHKKPIGAGGTSTKWLKSEDEDLAEKYKSGKIPETWWTDFSPVGWIKTERLGYPTQKPRALYQRIIQASSNKGDLVLDPFCGCGTTLMAAESLERKWIGIDLTYLAIGAVKTQAEKFFSTGTDSITVIGTPEDENTALELARTNSRGFEEWSVTHVLKFKSNAKKVADGGIDGTFRFPHDTVEGKMVFGKAVAQVKGGNYTLSHIRDFRTAMQNEEADLGVFVVTSPPTRGMRTEASRAGTYQHPFSNMEVPRLQIYEIQNHFRGIPPRLPFGERQVL